MHSKKENKEFFIGVDGGGTKTTAALANKNGEIIKRATSGPSSPRNQGIKLTVKNISDAIYKVYNNENILSVFIGLPSIEEEGKAYIEKIKKDILTDKRIKPALKNLVIGSDQLAAFYSKIDTLEGVLVIAGTGAVSRGFKGVKEVKASGWGWLSDEGSSFYVGQKSIQAILKSIDGRGKETLITKIAFKKLKVKDINSFLLKIYSSSTTEIVPLFSIFCNEASKRGDLIAKKILKESARELALSSLVVIKKLKFQKKKFPVVLVGSLFLSDIFLREYKNNITKIAPHAFFIFSKDPVIGSIKIAMKNYV